MLMQWIPKQIQNSVITKGWGDRRIWTRTRTRKTWLLSHTKTKSGKLKLTCILGAQDIPLRHSWGLAGACPQLKVLLYTHKNTCTSIWHYSISRFFSPMIAYCSIILITQGINFVTTFIEYLCPYYYCNQSYQHNLTCMHFISSFSNWNWHRLLFVWVKIEVQIRLSYTDFFLCFLSSLISLVKINTYIVSHSL